MKQSILSSKFNFIKLIVSQFFILSMLSCGLIQSKNSKSPTPPDTTVYKTFPARTLSLKQCRDEIPGKIFEDPSSRKSHQLAYREEHWFASSEYNERILAIFDAMPEYMRKSFCSIDLILIFVNDSAESDGNLANLKMVDDRIGDIIGDNLVTLRINKHLFLYTKDIPLEKYLSKSDHQYFYPKDAHSALTSDLLAGLPRFIDLKGNTGDSILEAILYHETAHIIDAYAFRYTPENRFCDYSWNGKQMVYYDPEIYGGFDYRPYVIKHYYGHYEGLRRDSYLNSLPPLEPVAFFDSLYKSTFVSSYASLNDHEDFAETLSYYLIWQKQKNLGNRFGLEKPDGTFYDLGLKMENGSMKEKITYVINKINNEMRYRNTFIDE